MLEDDLELNCQPWMSHPYYISIFHIHHIDYLGSNFTKLKYSDVLTPIIWRDQSHLDLHTNFISTWLYLVAFHHCIKNIGSLVPKYDELLTSHYDDLRYEEQLCLYILRAALDSLVLNRWVICSMMMYSYISPVCHTSIFTLFSYEDNQPMWHTTIYTR